MDNAQYGMSSNFERRGARSQPQVTFNIAVLSDFSAGSGARHHDAPVYVTKDNLNTTLDYFGATLHLDVENFLHREQAPLQIAIRVTDLSDLSPAGVVAHVPELTAIFLFKERVQSLLRQEISSAEFTAGLPAYESCAALIPALRRCRAALTPARNTPTAVSNPRGNNEVDRILDLVATPGQPMAPVTQGIEAVLHSISSPRKANALPVEITQVLNELTALLNQQITAVLHHPRFQRLEATWRGVKLLLAHAAGQDVKVELIDTSRDQLTEAFQARVSDVNNLAKDATQLGLVLVDFEFDSSSHDVNVLHALGQAAQAAQTPTVFSVRADFFGTAPDHNHSLPYIGTVLSQPRYSAWNALRSKECARWLCGAYNALLLRAPYSCENTRGLGYTEHVAERDNNLWGNPGWALAWLIARSMTNTHWPTQITGMQHGQITGLDVLAYRNRNGEVAIPLHALLSIENTDDLAKFGFAALTCQPNRDAVYLLNAPTLRMPESNAGRTAQDLTSLPYQLLASRVTALLGVQHDFLMDSGNSNQIAINARNVLDNILADTGPGAHAEVRIHADREHPERHQVDLELYTGSDILNGASLRLSVVV